VFTIVGLATAALTTRFGLVHLLGREPYDAAQSNWLAALWRRLAALPRPSWLAPLLALGSVVAMLQAPGEFWENNLAALTPAPPDLIAQDARLRRELGAPDVRHLLVIEGSDADAVLSASEKLEPHLARLQRDGVIAGYELPSRYLPSLATQRARQERLPEPAALQAALDEAQHGLPFKPGSFDAFQRDIAAARSLAPLTADRFFASPLGLRLKAQLQPREGHWIGLVSLVGVADTSALIQLAAQPDAPARLLDLKHASESLVAAYRTRVLYSLAVAAVLLVVVVSLALRRRSRVLRVLLPMAVTTLLILAALRLGGVSLSLFHLIALVLAAGLGLDYALFFEHVEDNELDQRRTLHAILVCSASTFLVFLLLALSSLPVLRAIGTTVTLGVIFNFVLALLLTRPRQEIADAGYIAVVGADPAPGHDVPARHGRGLGRRTHPRAHRLARAQRQPAARGRPPAQPASVRVRCAGHGRTRRPARPGCRRPRGAGPARLAARRRTHARLRRGPGRRTRRACRAPARRRAELAVRVPRRACRRADRARPCRGHGAVRMTAVLDTSPRRIGSASESSEPRRRLSSGAAA